MDTINCHKIVVPCFQFLLYTLASSLFMVCPFLTCCCLLSLAVMSSVTQRCHTPYSAGCPLLPYTADVTSSSVTHPHVPVTCPLTVTRQDHHALSHLHSENPVWIQTSDMTVSRGVTSRNRPSHSRLRRDTLTDDRQRV